MNIKRLKTLANYLLTINPKTFDLSEWSCGTTACAIGHAANIPEFKNAGFTLNFADDMRDTYPILINPIIGEAISRHWDAVEDFFDITEIESKHLFMDSAYGCEYDVIQPSDVSDRIFKLINTKT